MSSRQRGVTPVVSAIILVLIVVVAGGSAYTFITGIMEETEKDVADAQRTGTAVKDVRCDTAAVLMTVRNTGERPLTTDRILVTVTTPDGSVVATATARAPGAGFASPGGLGELRVLLDGVMQAGRTHRVRLHLPAEDHTVTASCTAERSSINLLEATSSFEDGTAGWLTQSGGTMSPEQVLDPFEGSAVLNVSADPAQSWSGARNEDVVGGYTPLQPDSVYTFAAWFYVPETVTMGGNWEFHRHVRTTDATGTSHNYDTLSSDVVFDDGTPKGEWFRKRIVVRTHTVTDPRGILFAVSQGSSGADGHVYVDGAMILPGNFSG